MLEPHSNKDMLLAQSVKETIINSSHDSISKYIDSGIRQLNEHADDYIERLDWNKLSDWVNLLCPMRNFLIGITVSTSSLP